MILVALDLTDVTADILDAARRWASADERLVVLHVAPEDPDFVTYRVGPDEEREEIARSLRDLRDRLDEEAKRLRDRGLEAETLLVQGRPAERILDEATRRGAALIVLGRHRHGRLHDVVVGTVAAGVLRSAPCPVLVVPPVE